MNGGGNTECLSWGLDGVRDGLGNGCLIFHLTEIEAKVVIPARGEVQRWGARGKIVRRGAI